MAGTLVIDTLKSSTANPPAFQNTSGTQIGTLCRAWVNFDGTTGTIRSSFNVSSITVLGSGQYSINFTNAMPDTSYALVGATGNDATGGANLRIFTSDTTNRTTTSVGCMTSTTSANVNNGFVQVAIFR